MNETLLRRPTFALLLFASSQLLTKLVQTKILPGSLKFRNHIIELGFGAWLEDTKD